MVHTPETTQCTYLKRAGTRCPNLGYNSRFHKHSTSHTLCQTDVAEGHSVSNKCEPCDKGMQGYLLRRMRRQAKQQHAEEAVLRLQQRKRDAEWDAYIDELVKSADGILDLSGDHPPEQITQKI